VATAATVVLVWEPEAGLAARPVLVRMPTAVMAETVAALPGPRAQPVRSAVLGQVKPVPLEAMARTSVESVEAAQSVQSAMESGER